MADRAHVRSTDDIDRFRSQLLTFLSGARAAVEESAVEVARQQAWLDLDRRKYWEGELWRRQRRLEEAKQALFQESIATQRGPASFLQMQVHRCERSLDESREKLNHVRAWGRAFEHRSLPMVRQVEQLHTVLTVDMARAVQFLTQSLAALDAYTGRLPSASTGQTLQADDETTRLGEPPPPLPIGTELAAEEASALGPEGEPVRPDSKPGPSVP